MRVLYQGSAVGGCIVYYRGMGKFKSVVEVIQEMPYEKKKILVNAVMDAISHLDITDLNKLAALVFNKDSVKKLIIDVLVFFLERTYNYKVNH
ncbi:uncharacterized protein LOC143250988 isoform X2 [Tachypleus tridentatus]|uniref:uncharacterized protein LOC143250988 isoform X2 n=1 Tax=Tachypleus tridentatus TaxID=6853 RepID=UPI003FD1E6A8